MYINYNVIYTVAFLVARTSLCRFPFFVEYTSGIVNLLCLLPVLPICRDLHGVVLC